jgi:membrane-bound lytic murein transglycosylase A
MISRRLITWLAALGVAPVMAQSLTVSVHEFNDLDGWQRDQHDQALGAFLETCPDLKATDWQTLCALCAVHR